MTLLQTTPYGVQSMIVCALCSKLGVEPLVIIMYTVVVTEGLVIREDIYSLECCHVTHGTFYCILYYFAAFCIDYNYITVKHLAVH